MPRNSINRVTLVGNLGAAPETRFTPKGTQVTTARLATDDRWMDNEGNTQSRTEWHKLVFWRRLAEIASQHLKKGSRVHVEGRLQTSSWDDVSGNRRSVTEVVVSDVKLLDSTGGPADMDLMYAREELRHLLPQHGKATEALEIGEDGLPF